jgi:hypothetical protein
MVLEKEMIATIAAAVEMEEIAKLTMGLAETQENKHRHQQQMVIVEIPAIEMELAADEKDNIISGRTIRTVFTNKQ